MKKAWSLLRPVVAFMAAGLATLAGFGLLLVGLWQFDGGSITYQWIAVTVSAVAALRLGGLVTAWLTKQTKPVQSVVFGGLFGAVSFTYILGLVPLALLLGAASGFIAGAGGFIDQRLLTADGQLLGA